MPLSQLTKFSEQRFTAFNHEIRIYIFGQDVSPWLRGALTVTYGNIDSFNTCSFELANPHQIFTWTETNLNPKFSFKSTAVGPVAPDKLQTVFDDNSYEKGFRGGTGEYGDTVKRAIFKWKTNKFINPKFTLDSSKREFGGRLQVNDKPVNFNPTSEPITSIKSNEERRFRLALGDCIFNKTDPMRIFVRNPLSTADEWMEVFCGYVGSPHMTTNYITGESNIRIEGHCIRLMMTKMRCSLNARNTGMSSDPLMTSGFFEDFGKASNQEHPFFGYPLEQTIRALILGETETQGLTNIRGQQTSTHGLGSFKPGNVVCYNPDPTKISEAKKTLRRWHLMTLFGVHKSPFPQEGENLWLTSQEVDKIGQETVPVDDLGVGGPDARYIHFLLPSAGTGAGTLIASKMEESLPGSWNWTTRWDVIREVASKLDFQVLTSPSGDILVEFPQYGFTPAAYSSTGSLTDEFIKDDFSNIFIFDRHMKEATVTDEGEDFPTILTVTGGAANQNLAGDGKTTATTQAGVDPQVDIYSPVLSSRFGVIMGHVEVPFAAQKGGDLGSFAVQDTLNMYGMVEFTKRMAAASSVAGSLVYRPFIFPNRPIYFKRCERVALIDSVTHTWNIKQDAQTNVSSKMVMAKRINNERKFEFRLMSGAANTPIDYNCMWSQEQKVCPNSGLFSYVTNNSKDQNAPTEGPNAPSPTGANNYQGNKGSKSLDSLYGPFREKVQAAINAWQSKYPNDPIVVSSVYRTASYQASLRSNYLTNKAAGRPAFVAAEPWSSWHQYGLAVDMFPSSTKGQNGKGSAAKYQEWADIARKASGGGTDGLHWFGPGDEVHFQMPDAWSGKIGGVSGAKRMVAGKGDDAYRDVWKQLDYALGISPNKPAVEQGPPATATSAAPTLGAAPATQTPVGAVKAAPECTPSILTSADFISPSGT